MVPYLSNILFLDIETVPVCYRYEDLDPVSQELWDEKVRYQAESNGVKTSELYEKAGVLAEFAKVICICIGFFYEDNGERKLRLKTISGDDEHELLLEFSELIDEKFSRYQLCAHNGKEFDFPFLGRRMLINGIKIPSVLSLAGKKPWEVNHLDTMDLWKFGDRKHFTSLKLLAHLFNLPTPKDDISGKDVARVYWEERDLHRIAVYCQKDVITLANLVLRWEQQPILEESQLSFA